MQLYELTHLISSELSEKESKELQSKIISLIEKKEGILVEEISPLKKNLAYAIKEQEQAYLATVKFQLIPEKLTDLENFLKSEKQILRFIILKTKKLKISNRAVKTPESPKKTKTEKPKVKLKEIERKLEEILIE